MNKLVLMTMLAGLSFAAWADGSGLAESEFTPLFNGKDLSGWAGDKNVYWVPEEGILQCGGREGVQPKPDDYILTEKEYADFVVRFDFRTWKGGDNGIGIRYPGVDDMAYSGIEMQLADTVHANWPRHCSMGGFYGVGEVLDDRTETQPHLGATYIKPVGEWNACEIKAEGSRLTAWINGVKVNDVDLATRDPNTGFDNHPHSGVRAKKGHFIFWVGNPSVPTQWRNLRVKELKTAASVDPHARRFLYSDFMNHKVVYVDEGNRDAYWEAFLPDLSFDITRCGLNRLVIAQMKGWLVYDLCQMRLLKDVRDPEHIKGYATSVTQLPDGRTFVLSGPSILEYDAADKFVHAYTFGDRVKETRAMRFTDRGTVLIGAYSGFAEVKLDRDEEPAKRVLKWFQLPGAARYCYQAEWQKDGTLLTTGGYLPEVVKFAADGQVLSRVQAKQPEGLNNYFYAGFQMRPNGNLVVANWTGHSGKDFIPGWKLIEFSPKGDVVWTWNAPWAGTPNAVIVFD